MMIWSKYDVRGDGTAEILHLNIVYRGIYMLKTNSLFLFHCFIIIKFEIGFILTQERLF